MEKYFPLFLYFYDYGPDDNLTWTTNPNCLDLKKCDANVTNLHNLGGFFLFNSTIKAVSKHKSRVRYGGINRNKCKNGVIITNERTFHLGEFVNDPNFLPEQEKCVIMMCKECRSEFKNELGYNDKIEVLKSLGIFEEITDKKTKKVITDGTKIIYLKITKGNETGIRNNQNIVFTYPKNESLAPPTNDEIFYVDTEDPFTLQYPLLINRPLRTPCVTPFSTPYKTPHKSPHFTPFSTPHESTHSTPHKSPHSTPHESTHSTPHKSPHSTPHESIHSTPHFTPFFSPKNTKYFPFRTPKIPPATLLPTPHETWNGEWEEVVYNQPRMMPNDVPQIKETHPPLQTEYHKTEVPQVETVTNISFGIIVVSVVVVITAVNIYRTARMIKQIKNGEVIQEKIDMDNLEFDSSSFISSSSIELYSENDSYFQKSDYEKDDSYDYSDISNDSSFNESIDRILEMLNKQEEQKK